MKFSTTITVALAALIVLGTFGAAANDKYSSSSSSLETPYGYHPCATETKAVTKSCKKGDPCGVPCQKAEKKLKACRIANNLPKHEAGGSVQKPDCTTPDQLPGAPVDNTPEIGNPVNPLRSNHF